MLKRFIFWDFPRASWQYDVMVGIILAFIFLTPRSWFRDQPRIGKASSIAMISSENGVSAFFVQAELVAGVPDDQREAKLNRLVQTKTGDNRLTVTRIEPVYDSEGHLQGYMASARR